MPLANDSLFMYAASDASELVEPFLKLAESREAYWRRMDDSAGFRNPPERSIFGATFTPYKRDAHFKFSQISIDQMIGCGRVRLRCKTCGEPHTQGEWKTCKTCGETDANVQYLVEETDKKVLDTNWTDIAGYAHTTGFSTENAVVLLKRAISVASGRNGLILDFFAGSGTTGHAAIALNRDDSGARKFVLVEMGDHFDTVLLPRIKKITFSPEWKDDKPKRFATPEEAERSPRIIKVVRLESYEDTLNNLDLRRSEQQQSLLDNAQSQGSDKLKEQYLLRYQLNVESHGSQSLLNIANFSDPTAYKLLVKTPGSDESREVSVDLLETFNYLTGLTVQHMAAPRSFVAEFEHDSEGRLQLKGRLKQEPAGPWWFRTVTGTTPEGRKTLVIWRKLTGDAEQDNLVLDTWFKGKQAYSVRDTEFDLIYVNGDNTLENLRVDPETWKVRLIEEDFQRLMFDGTEA